jgi:hypothetical protein
MVILLGILIDGSLAGALLLGVFAKYLNLIMFSH